MHTFAISVCFPNVHYVHCDNFYNKLRFPETLPQQFHNNLICSYVVQLLRGKRQLYMLRRTAQVPLVLLCEGVIQGWEMAI